MFRVWIAMFGSMLIFGCGDRHESHSTANSEEDGPLIELLDFKKTGVDFSNDLVDDPLGDRNVLSWRHYYHGAGVAIGDINNDGLPDIFMVSNEGPNRLFLNKGDFEFEDITESSGINDGNKQWSTGAVMVDINGNGYLDIYVLQAGYGILDREDRENLLLINNGDNTFTERAAEFGLNDANESVSAVFFDYNNNGQMDLIIVGEWMPVMIFINEGGTFRDASEEYGTADLRGWWYSVAVEDLDGNGKVDIILGNVGLNTKFKASEKEPFHDFADDFDDDGNVDIVLSKYYKGKLVPSRGRECSSEQMPFILSKFPTYEDYATASLMDVYGEDNIQEALHLQVNTLASTVLLNQGGHFEHRKLPNLAQISPINRIIVEDVNSDGIPDLIIAGNMYNTEVETPRYDAGSGLVLIGNGKGDFETKGVTETGFFAPHNVKDLAIIRNTASGKPLIWWPITTIVCRCLRWKTLLNLKTKRV